MTSYLFLFLLSIYITPYFSLANNLTFEKQYYYDCTLFENHNKKITKIDFRASSTSSNLIFEKNNRSTKLIVTYGLSKKLSFAYKDMINNKIIAYGKTTVNIFKNFTVAATAGNKNISLACAN